MKNKITVYDVGPKDITTGQDVEVHFIRGKSRYILYRHNISIRGWIRREFHRAIIILIGIYQVVRMYVRRRNNHQ